MSRTVAALFVATNGVYFGVPGVEPWDLKRSALAYDGPFSVVAHPPCERWGRFALGYSRGSTLANGRFASGGQSVATKTMGDDGGCFASALASVRCWGGGVGASGGIPCVACVRDSVASAFGRMDLGRRWRLDVLCFAG